MLSKTEIENLLGQFQIDGCKEYECIDSSHGERDMMRCYVAWMKSRTIAMSLSMT